MPNCQQTTSASSRIMAGILPSGAYLMRNKQTDTVIEIDDFGQLVTANENPNGRREQQIWWVEPLPGPEHETEEGPIYSIINISQNLTVYEEEETVLTVGSPDGFPNQKWWIKRVQDDKDGEFYNITNVLDGNAIDIEGDNPHTGALCLASKFSHQSHKQRWEFVCPAVAVPPGWVQIRSVSPGQPLLQQMYLTSLPFLASVTPESAPPNYGANWGTQWTFLLGDRREDSTKRYWCIRNRLTGGFLCHFVECWRKNGEETNVNAALTWHEGNLNEMMWRLDIHRDGYWTLLNKSSNSLLLARESSPDAGAMMQVSLAEKDIPVENNHKKWEILELYKMERESTGEKPLEHRVL